MYASFSFHLPTNVCFGRNAEKEAGRLIRECGGHHALVIYGSQRIIRSGLLARIHASMDEAGIAWTDLGGVVPNPRLSLVHEGIALGRQAQADFLLAVGGGSVIDTAKAIALGLASEGEVWDFFAHTRTPEASQPVGAVLTIAASGSEMSNSAVITNEELGIKRSCNHPLEKPVFAIMNPELTLTLPPYETACGCTDILMHTLERYFSAEGTMAITDSIAEALMRQVMASSLILLDHPDQYEARADIMWAGSLSHNGLTGCGGDGGDWACHGLEHELSARYDVAHGAGLAAIWGSWARFVMLSALPRFRRLAEEVLRIPAGKSDAETALAGIEAMEAYFRRIGMPASLQELGLNPTAEEIAAMARQCAAISGGHRGSARVLYEEDMRQIYEGSRSPRQQHACIDAGGHLV